MERLGGRSKALRGEWESLLDVGPAVEWLNGRSEGFCKEREYSGGLVDALEWLGDRSEEVSGKRKFLPGVGGVMRRLGSRPESVDACTRRICPSKAEKTPVTASLVSRNRKSMDRMLGLQEKRQNTQLHIVISTPTTLIAFDGRCVWVPEIALRVDVWALDLAGSVRRA